MNCYIGLGSNLGERSANIKQALRLISQSIGPLTAKSFLYESPPWGTYEGESFPYLNVAILVSTQLEASEVLAQLLSTEATLGRRRSTQNAPRTLDLDILYYGEQIIKTDTLIVPHPHLANRRFVLEPLNDLAPGFVHPILGLSNKQLLYVCPDPQEELTRV